MSREPITFGRYELMERLAMGGMAEVFKGRHVGREGFQKEVCIKRILPQFCTEDGFIKMFIDEAKLAARLQHANIVQIFDFDQVDGSYYIAMELIHGKDLRTVVRTGVEMGMPLGSVLAAHITAEMCKGLYYAHQREGLGLVHRDISPHNVLVSMTGEVKVMDFGIAKAADRITHTSTGIIKGKLAYMAPEQAAGAEIDHRVDQFATALVLFEMLTGRRAYEGNEPVVLRKALQADVEPPSLSAPDVPPELDEIFLKATAADPNARYPDMRAFERALMQFIYKRAPSDEEQDLGLHMRRLFDEDPYAAPTENMFDGDAPSRLLPTTASSPSGSVSGVFADGNGAVPSAPTSQSDPRKILGGDAPAPAQDQQTRTHMATPAARTASRATAAVVAVRNPAVQPVDLSPVVSPPGVPSSPAIAATPAKSGVPVSLLAGGVGAVALAVAGFVFLGRSPTTPAVPTPPPATAAAAAPAPAQTPEPAPAPAPAPAPEPEPVKEPTPTAPEKKEKPRETADNDKRGRRVSGTGTVQFYSPRGWAEVVVDGDAYETPATRELPAGKRKATFRNPETGQEKTVTFIVKANETIRVASPLK